MMDLKRASIIGALFFCPSTFSAPIISCQTTGITHPYRVSTVFDGDTLLLENGSKVRFIGINAPETAKQGRPAESYANLALASVQKLLQKSGGRVGLVRGQEPLDHYGRVLAHVFLPHYGNLTAYLLRLGLGSHIAIPPNLNYLECYRQSEQLARNQANGRWGASNQGITPVNHLHKTTRGFRHVRGTITRIGEGPTNVWLNFDNHLAIKIGRKDLSHFKDGHPRTMLNRTIEARGWIYYKKSQLRMRIRHPAMIRVLHESQIP